MRTILAERRPGKALFHRLLTLAHALVARPRLALTTTASLPYKPRDFGRGEPRQSAVWARGQARCAARASQPSTSSGQRRTTREADLSTEQAGAQAPSRFSCPHGDQRRPQGGCRAPRARTQAAQRLTSAATRPASSHGAAQAPRRFPGRRDRGQGADRGFRVAGAQATATAVRSASASPSRERSEPRSSAIGCGAASGKS